MHLSFHEKNYIPHGGKRLSPSILSRGYHQYLVWESKVFPGTYYRGGWMHFPLLPSSWSCGCTAGEEGAITWLAVKHVNELMIFMEYSLIPRFINWPSVSGLLILRSNRANIWKGIDIWISVKLAHSISNILCWIGIDWLTSIETTEEVQWVVQ